MEESNKAYQARKIAEADGLFNEAKFEEALISYQSAKRLKEDENYPDQKINEINVKLPHLPINKKELQKKYSDFIKNADASFKKSKLEAFQSSTTMHCQLMKVKNIQKNN